jgi:hypothetical protein
MVEPKVVLSVADSVTHSARTSVVLWVDELGTISADALGFESVDQTAVDWVAH